MISLYLKRHWNDKATANAIAEGLWDKCTKVIEGSARFILGDVVRVSSGLIAVYGYIYMVTRI